MATLRDIFSNTQDDLAEPPGSPIPVAAPPATPSSSLEADLRSVQQEDAISRMQEVRQAQAQALQQHAQYRAGLDQAQSQVDLRGQDLDVAERLMGVLDSRVPKLVRLQSFRELSARLSVDPKSSRATELGRTLIGLDPDSSADIRGVFASQLEGASPGEISQFATAILKGEVGMHELTKMVGQTRRQLGSREAFYAQHGPPMMAGASDATVPQAQPADPDEVASSIVSQAGDAKTAPDLRQVHPEIAKMYGLDPNTPYRNSDVISRGYKGPLSMKDQEKWVKEHATTVEDSAKVLDSFVLMEYISRGRPEVLRTPKFTVPVPGAPIQVEVPTLSEFHVGLYNTMKAWGWYDDSKTKDYPTQPYAATGTPTERLQSFSDSAAPIGEIGTKEKFMGKRIARRLTDDIKGTELEQLPRPDVDNPDLIDRTKENTRLTGILDSHSAELVYRMGRMAGQSGHAFSDKDRDVFTQQYASSSDPDARRAAMQASAGKMFADMDPALVNGLAGRIFARNNPEMTQAYLDSPVVPKNVKDAIRARAEAAVTPTSQQPTHQQPVQQQTPAQQVQPQQRSESNPVPGMVVTEPRQSAAATSAQQQPQQAQPKTIQEERVALQKAQAQAQSMIIEKHNIAIARFKMDEQIAKENRDYRARQEARQARKDAEEQRDKLRAAFNRAGSMLASGRSGGGGGGAPSMGGDQDAAAFKIAPHPGANRPPPTPAPARGGFENVRRMKGSGA